MDNVYWTMNMQQYFVDISPRICNLLVSCDKLQQSVGTLCYLVLVTHTWSTQAYLGVLVLIKRVTLLQRKKMCSGYSI